MKASVTVRFVSGREEKFEMQAWGGAGAKSRVQAIVEKPLLIQTSNELVVIPVSAIECISIKFPKGESHSFSTMSARPRGLSEGRCSRSLPSHNTLQVLLLIVGAFLVDRLP